MRYLTRFRIDKAAISRRRESGWDDYRIHKEVGRVFKEENSQFPALYRVRQDDELALYTLSNRLPGEHDIFVDARTREFNPTLVAGEKLLFDVVVNATVDRMGKRHDVILDEKKARNQRGEPSGQTIGIAQMALGRWMKTREREWGISVDPTELMVHSYETKAVQKPGKKDAIRISMSRVSGALVVKDPEACAAMLYKGIGRSKSFGCGLVLVRRP